MEAAINPVADPLPSAEEGFDQDGRTAWFNDHYGKAADEVIDFLAGDHITLDGKDVADIGCGDGFTDLGLVVKGRPRRIVGFDVNATDLDKLRREALHQGVVDELPSPLEFVTCGETSLPAGDASFDVVISWSAFEHVLKPVEVLSEVRRVLRPDGVFFLQLWPFYYSEHGSHLWHWFRDGFANMRHTDDEIAERLRADTETDPAWIETKIRDNRELNQITLDGLQQAMLTAGLQPTKVELMSHTVHLSKELNRFPLSDLLIAGVKMLAVPAR